MIGDPTELVLMYFVLPLWFCAGLADWACHRATDLEHTTGAKESLIHLLMFAEVGIPLVMVLVLEVNALIIAVMIAAFLLHEATALWDVSYAVEHREVRPIEQHVHSFLEMVPLMALLLVVVRHWDQFLALVGLGSEPARFVLEWKVRPLPVAYLAMVLAGAFVLEFVPYLQELRRALRAGALSATLRRPTGS